MVPANQLLDTHARDWVPIVFAQFKYLWLRAVAVAEVCDLGLAVALEAYAVCRAVFIDSVRSMNTPSRRDWLMGETYNPMARAYCKRPSSVSTWGEDVPEIMTCMLEIVSSSASVSSGRI
jgi:hypothetical protein